MISSVWHFNDTAEKTHSCSKQLSSSSCFEWLLLVTSMSLMHYNTSFSLWIKARQHLLRSSSLFFSVSSNSASILLRVSDELWKVYDSVMTHWSTKRFSYKELNSVSVLWLLRCCCNHIFIVCCNELSIIVNREIRIVSLRVCFHSHITKKDL